jgi:hypothetical protein
MAKGCLAALFGIGLNGPSSGSSAGGMTEGDVHSGPGGYEGMGYSGGYAADYRAGQKAERESDVPPAAPSYDSSIDETEDYGFEEGEA